MYEHHYSVMLRVESFIVCLNNGMILLYVMECSQFLVISGFDSDMDCI